LQHPLPLSASAIAEGALWLRLSGASSAVAAAQRQLGGEVVPEKVAEHYWRGLREHTTGFFSPDAELPLWRLSIAATAPPLMLREHQLIEWHGALRWLRTAAPAREVRAAALQAGGHATLFRGGDDSIDAFTPLTPALMQLHLRLKHSFDPQGIFNRGRLYRDF
jgi:glycolate oxidase FAD binding subunit